MFLTRSFLVAAAGTVCALGQANAAPLIIAPPLPPAAAAMLGSWQDAKHLLLPPGIGAFETVSDVIRFKPDGTFTQTINKATGRVREAGQYTVTGSRLTLSYVLGSEKPARYEFSRAADHLLLTLVGPAKPETVTLFRS